jgi:hypothetical protein
MFDELQILDTFGAAFLLGATPGLRILVILR